MEDSQLTQYVPVLILALVAIAFAAGTLVASVLLGKLWLPQPAIKDTAYECGMLPVGEGSSRFSIKFYVVAMLFVLFDIEVVFMYPWAVVYKQMLVENGGADFRFHGHVHGHSFRRLHLRAEEARIRLEELTAV